MFARGNFDGHLPLDTIDGMENYTHSGNYLIVYCKAGVPRSHAIYLQQLLPYMQSSLQAVLNNVNRGTASPAYRAFFKTNDNLDTVRQVFTDIINDFSVIASRPQTVSSVLICTEADVPFLNQLRGRCSNPEGTRTFTMEPHKIVFLWPSIWSMRRAARKAACPVIVNGQVETEPRQLRLTKFATLVHELVHVYNKFDHMQHPSDDTDEVYDLEDVVGLNIQAVCTQFPVPLGSEGGMCPPPSRNHVWESADICMPILPAEEGV